MTEVFVEQPLAAPGSSNQLRTEVFVEQPLASPGSANHEYGALIEIVGAHKHMFKTKQKNVPGITPFIFYIDVLEPKTYKTSQWCSKTGSRSHRQLQELFVGKDHNFLAQENR